MSNAVLLVHVVAAGLLLVSLVALAWDGEPRYQLRFTLAGAVCSVLCLATGLARLTTWQWGYRRSVYLYSRSAGLWLDRKQLFGAGACLLALALAALLRAKLPPLQRRSVAALAAILALAALSSLAYVHAAAPTGALEAP